MYQRSRVSTNKHPNFLFQHSNSSSHNCLQGCGVLGNETATIAGTNWLAVGQPEVLGSRASALRRLVAGNRHGVVVVRIVDGRNIIPTSRLDEVGLSPGCLECARRSSLTADFGPGNLRILLESYDLRGTRGEGESEGGVLGSQCGSREHLHIRANLVPDVDDDRLRLGVLEGVCVCMVSNRVDLDNIGSIWATIVAPVVVSKSSRW